MLVQSILIVALLTTIGCSSSKKYPSHWFEPVDSRSKASWEILPQEANSGEVILSKRTELGLLSNFAATPFIYHEKRYASVEGFWQMLLYPEKNVDKKTDPRSKLSYPYTREQVAAMTGFEAKQAGDLAEKNMRLLGIDWVSFEGKKIKYHDLSVEGQHYHLIVNVMKAKMNQNPAVKAILKSTGNLKLRADHIVSQSDPPSWKYYEIWENLRYGL